MKIPTMTTGKHWLYLFGLIFVEAVLAFWCFVVGPPISYLGLAIVILANIEFIIATITGVKNSTNVTKN